MHARPVLSHTGLRSPLCEETGVGRRRAVLTRSGEDDVVREHAGRMRVPYCPERGRVHHCVACDLSSVRRELNSVRRELNSARQRIVEHHGRRLYSHSITFAVGSQLCIGTSVQLARCHAVLPQLSTGTSVQLGGGRGEEDKR